MEQEKMFEIASRQKLRFPFKGQISTEDLWDLDIDALNKVFKSLNAKLKEAEEESLLQKRSAEDDELALKINIIKHIFDVKVAEAEKARRAHQNKEERQKILGIMADKQEEALRNMTPEQLQAMLDDLN